MFLRLSCPPLSNRLDMCVDASETLILGCPQAAAREDRAPAVHTGARSFCTAFQCERARKVQRICEGIQRWRARGESLAKAGRWYAGRYRDQHWKSRPNRRMGLSWQTIRRLWYRWNAGGRTPGAVALLQSARRLPAEGVLDLARICLAPDITSLRAAYARLVNPAGGIDGLRGRLPVKTREAIIALLAARRALERLQCKARRDVGGEDHGREPRPLDPLNEAFGRLPLGLEVELEPAGSAGASARRSSRATTRRAC